MNDLELDPNTGDLKISNQGAGIVMGAARVRQNLEVKLRLWAGEWFLDTEFGTPYLDGVLGKQVSLNASIASIKKSILEVADVDRITDFSYAFNRATRTLSVSFECHTPYGLIRTKA